jgi:hypothetical protein
MKFPCRAFFPGLDCEALKAVYTDASAGRAARSAERGEPQGGSGGLMPLAGERAGACPGN